MLGRTSVRAVRLQGALPRHVFVTAMAVLSLVGLRSLVAPTPPANPVAAAARDSSDSNVEGFAEMFARAFMTFDEDGGDRRARALAEFGLPADEALDAGTVHHASSPEWSAVVGSSPRRDGADVTVALSDGTATTFVAVPVTATPTGLAVRTAPAIVGGPDARVAQKPIVEWEVDDQSLAAVANRVVRHYVAADRIDLAADLAKPPPTLPRTRLRVADVDAPTWAIRGRVIAARAHLRSPGGLRMELRYELAVVRRGGRWLVTDINHTTPKEVQP